MDFILIFLIPIILLVSLFAIPSSKKGTRSRVSFFLLGLPFIFFFGDEIIGQTILHTLCTINGGYKYSEIINTEGYFDSENDRGCEVGCLEALTRWGFLYYETEVHNGYKYHAPKKGIYKYFLTDKKTLECSGKKVPRETGILPEDKCVSYNIISKPTSKYEVFMIEHKNIIKWPFELNKKYSYVKDRTTDKIIASATSYQYWGGWVRNNAFGHNSASTCPSFKESHGAIQNLIITSKVRK